jgi:hypothetical protein
VAVLWDGHTAGQLMDGQAEPVFLADDDSVLLRIERRHLSYLWSRGIVTELPFRAQWIVQGTGILGSQSVGTKDRCVEASPKKVDAATVDGYDFRTIYEGVGCQVRAANSQGQIIVSLVTGKTVLLAGSQATELNGIDPRAMNSHGTIVGTLAGTRWGDSDVHPAMWKDGAITRLEGEVGAAEDINDNEVAVGWVAQGGRHLAAAWVRGHLVLLNDFVRRSEPRVVWAESLKSINRDNRVAGVALIRTGSPSPVSAAFVATISEKDLGGKN